MMELLKKWRKHDHNGGSSGDRAIVRRDRHGRDDWGLSRFRQEMDRAFDRVWRDFDRGDPWSALSHLPATFGSLTDWPAIDVAEDEKAMTLRIDVPGLDARDVDLEVSGNLLTIRGQREDEWSENRKGIYRRERRSGSFARTIPLPSYVDANNVEARYDKGTLTVTIPRIPGQGPTRVQVKA